MDDLRFPIGQYAPQDPITPHDISQWIDGIAALPGQLSEAVRGLDDAQLDTPYRPEGWTLRQVVHHIADSHMNAYIRFKLSLTEATPEIRPYFEDRWAELPDSHAPVSFSLDLTRVLHARWVYLLRVMTPDDFSRRYYHPEHQQSFPLDYVAGMYCWHGAHHVAHITTLRTRKAW